MVSVVKYLGFGFSYVCCYIIYMCICIFIFVCLVVFRILVFVCVCYSVFLYVFYLSFYAGDFSSCIFWGLCYFSVFSIFVSYVLLFLFLVYIYIWCMIFARSLYMMYDYLCMISCRFFYNIYIYMMYYFDVLYFMCFCIYMMYYFDVLYVLCFSIYIYVCMMFCRLL